MATIVAGRRDHLVRQARAVAALPGVADYLIVAMDDAPVTVPGADVVRVVADDRGLPLAAARNRALAALAGHDLVVMLDVDCIPDRALLARYRDADRRVGPGLLAGPVGYLDAIRSATADGDGDPSAAERARARRRVIRDFPRDGVRREPRHELFWSLSFAVTPAVHAAIGGFDEGYVGYGAEDTDYGLRAAAAGVELWFVAGAWAYHQPHRPDGPARASEVAANASRFHAAWGYWPMPDTLAELRRRGAIRWSETGDRCEAVDSPA